MSFASTRSRSEENRISPVFWVLVAVLATSAWGVATGTGNARFGLFLFVVAGWMVSLCLHEYAHARTALHGGDITVGAKGYLTLNPLKYGHVLLSFVLPVIFVMLGGIGLPGGAVYIDRHRIQGRWKHSLVSAAGPLVNVAFAVVLMLLARADLYGDSMLPEALAFLAFLQITAALLNLLPVPGLDGYGIVEPWLSYKTRRAVEPFAPYSMLVLFAVFWQTEARYWLSDAALWIMEQFGVRIGLVISGHDLFMFWQ
ncbi:site-2 protease family protein [Kitasatospora terrestris]|uniref:Site-2 protease family protein n=1 Tax=Kitasatospora terrestris TaxID=258051 RepID=A0ABP9DLH4_9ACTN